jgi:hypothetical protein
VLSGSLGGRDREIVLLMDGVVRFVNVGRQVGACPRTIPLGEVPTPPNKFFPDGRLRDD